MKKITFTLLFATLGLFAFGQDFAPVGTEWYYTQRWAFSGDVGYFFFTSEKDTIIEGKICQEIVKEEKIICNDRPDTEYLFTSNDTVYFFDTAFNEFQIMYVFDAQPSDSWIIKIKDSPLNTDTVTVYVDSISTTSINGEDLKTLHVTYSLDYDTLFTIMYHSVIIEKLGDLTYLFNWAPKWAATCDYNWSPGIRCYEDPFLGFYTTGVYDSCSHESVWIDVGVEDQNSFTQSIEVFPNPVKDLVNIQVKNLHTYSIELRDIQGRLVRSKMANNELSQLDLTEVERGIYFVIVREEGVLIGSEKVMVD